MSDKYLWLCYVALAGLSWGTYVPIIFYGGNELGGKPGSRRYVVERDSQVHPLTTARIGYEFLRSVNV